MAIMENPVSSIGIYPHITRQGCGTINAALFSLFLPLLIVIVHANGDNCSQPLLTLFAVLRYDTVSAHR